MVRKHILSTIFLVFISTNVIQAEIPGGFFNFLPIGRLFDFPRIREFTSNFASSATEAAKDALGRFGFGENIVSTEPGLFNRFVNRGRFFPRLRNLLSPNSDVSSAASASASSAGAPQAVKAAF